MLETHPVIEGLRKTLASSRGSARFVDEMEARIRQLLADKLELGSFRPR